MSTRRLDRRNHARFPHSLEAHGSASEGGVIARMALKNLSLGGLYCTSTTDFPEMTRLAVRLVLPERGTECGAPLDVEAVVVRRRALGSGGTAGNGRYELALFFSSMSDHQRERLARFLALC